jgi:hypothetical protein
VSSDPYVHFRARFIELGAPSRVVRADGSLDEDWLDRHGWIERSANHPGTHRVIGANRAWYYRVWGKVHYAYWRRRQHYRRPGPLDDTAEVETGS